MTEKGRKERFDEVFQMVLIIVALSFDILWFFEIVPVAEIGVFIFILVIWAYGNLRGGKWEYASKLGSFNLAIILMSNFYTVALTGGQKLPMILHVVIGGIIFPLICLGISLSLYSYLRESMDREIARGILIGGTIGYMSSVIIVALLAG
ncbi:MAG: hypothetical protein ACW98Y_08835 [Candidatus Thorarchaeota archaeon]|jgi:hypothetical protein